jgi:hypothetical protein
MAELVDHTPIEYSPRPLTQLYREVVKTCGLTRMEIFKRIGWGVNVSKGLRHLDALLDGTCKLQKFEERFVEAMEIPADVLSQARAKDQSWIQQVRSHRNRAISHAEYRSTGPYAKFLPNEKWKPTNNMSRWFFDLANRAPVNMAYYPRFVPPTAEEMGYTIATSPELIARGFPGDQIGGYFYHRLPDEFYTYDTAGNLL